MDRPLTLAIVGDPGDPSGRMYEEAARAAGIVTMRMTLSQALQDIRCGTSTLRQHSLDDPYASAASLTGAHLARHARVRAADMVIDVSFELQHYVAVVNQVWHDAGIVTINAPGSVWLSQDKYATYRTLAEAGVPTPRTVLVSTLGEASTAAAEIGFPVVMKGLTSTHGDQVMLARDTAALDVNWAGHGSRSCIVQEFVDGRGRDLRVLTVDRRVVGAITRTAASGEFRANLARGGRASATSLGEDEAALAIKVSTVLGLSLAGIDFIRRGGSAAGPGLLCLEANCSPGLAGLRLASGINAAHEVLHVLAGRAKDRPSIP